MPPDAPTHAKWELAALLFVVGLGVWLDVALSGDVRRSIWFDEAFSWRLSGFSIPELLARAARDNNPPLYYVALNAWTAVWGESLFALRSLSVAMHALTTVGAWAFAREAFGRRPNSTAIGLLAAALVATSGLHVKWAGEVRMYSLGTALAALSSALLLVALRRNRRRDWILYATCALACSFTHTYALFTVAAQAMVLLASLLPARAARWTQVAATRARPRSAWFALLAVAAGYALWMPVLLRQRAQVQADFWTIRLTWRRFATTCYELWIEPINGQATAAEGALLAAFTLLLLLSLCWRPVLGEWATFCLAAVPVGLGALISALDIRIFATHYLLFAHLFMLVALARLIYRLRFPVERAIVGAVAVAGMALMTAEWHTNLEIERKPGAIGAAAFIDSARSRDELVVVGSPLIYLSVLYHSNDRQGWRLYDNGADARIHYYGAAAIIDEELVREVEIRESAAARVWVVNMQGGGWGTRSVPVPHTWTVLSRQVFSEVYEMQGDIVVVEYATRANE